MWDSRVSLLRLWRYGKPLRRQAVNIEKMNEQPRGVTLTIFAVLFGLLAISNFLKPIEVLGHSGTPGFVFLGTRTSGIANDILGPLFGLILAVYARGIWRMKKYALPLSYAYAAYVVLNLILFAIKYSDRGSRSTFSNSSSSPSPRRFL